MVKPNEGGVVTTIDQLLDAPVVSYDVRITDKDPLLAKFGIMWKIYDMVGDHRR